ncbi:MAG: STAS domain-containing protein [Acidobacteria bacterium]|nr:STAS domain-containing protein [Acidobacteriota bacterium]
MSLSTAVSEVDDWYVVSVHGDLDMATAPTLRQFISTLHMSRPLMILDLRGVGFIDSTGLGVIIGVLKRLRTADGELRVAVDVARVRRVFEITDLTKVFRLYNSPEEAVADPYD